MRITAFDCEAASYEDSRRARLQVRYQVEGQPLSLWIHFQVPGRQAGESGGHTLRATGTTYVTVDLDRELFENAYLMPVSFWQGPTNDLLFKVGVQLGLDEFGRPTATKVVLPPLDT